MDKNPTEGSMIQTKQQLRSTFLTPRFETMVNGSLYTTMNDPEASVAYDQTDKGIFSVTNARLLNEHKHSLTGSDACEIRYNIVGNEFIIQAKCLFSEQVHPVKYLLPVISNYKEKIWVISPSKVEIAKAGSVVHIEA